MTQRRSRHLKSIAALGAALLMAVASGANAQSSLFASENVSAWLDLRLTSSTGERGWTDGGFGKLRYGGDETRARLGQAGLLWKPRLADTITAYVLLENVPDAQKPWGISEAYLKWKPVPTSDWRYSLRLGQMFPPISQEHDGTGWTPSRTLTPSAINSWIGEEVLVDGIEASVEKGIGDHRLGLTVGGFTRNDTAGTLLSWRGWALHDISSADNTELKLPDGNQGYVKVFKLNQALVSKPLAEIDHRLGYYVRMDWQPPWLVGFNAEYYDNQGDPSTVRNGQWGWDTKFYNLGLRAQPAPNDEILSQYMRGRTITGWRSAGLRVVDVGFDSAYVLWAHNLNGQGKLSGRIDYFATKDLTSKVKDDNTERGYAATVAWGRPLTPHLDLMIEGVHVVSNRPARVTQTVLPEQAQTLVQLALKVHL